MRGCLLELLDWLRTSDQDATEREASVVGDENGSPLAPAASWQALEDYLDGRRVATITGQALDVVSVDDPALQAQLDSEPGVRALLDSDLGRQALLPAGASSGRRVHLDAAGVHLSTELGRDITRACSLALRDRPDPPDGIHYRSRHDDTEDCWALYDHAAITVTDVVPLSPNDPGHRAALHTVASLWQLALPPRWTSAR